MNLRGRSLGLYSIPVENTAQERANAALKKGDALGWFEHLYKEAQGDATKIPWVDLKPTAGLIPWLDRNRIEGTALVIGCGLGDDAEELARRGLTVTAFDVSPTAIEWCRKRFPKSKVSYLTADLFRFTGKFDFVLEAYTLQSLPVEPRKTAMECIVHLVGKRLLVVSQGRDPKDEPGCHPWPLTRQELARFESLGLKQVQFEDFVIEGTRRFLVEYSV